MSDMSVQERILVAESHIIRAETGLKIAKGALMQAKVIQKEKEEREKEFCTHSGSVIIDSEFSTSKWGSTEVTLRCTHCHAKWDFYLQGKRSL